MIITFHQSHLCICSGDGWNVLSWWKFRRRVPESLKDALCVLSNNNRTLRLMNAYVLSHHRFAVFRSCKNVVGDPRNLNFFSTSAPWQQKFAITGNEEVKRSKKLDLLFCVAKHIATLYDMCFCSQTNHIRPTTFVGHKPSITEYSFFWDCIGINWKLYRFQNLYLQSFSRIEHQVERRSSRTWINPSRRLQSFN